MKTFGLVGKSILVTGSEGFLGKHLVQALQEEGALIIPVDSRAGAYEVDLSDTQQIKDFVKSLGQTKIDGLINNAAVSFKGRLNTEDQWDKTFDVNVKGAYYLTKELENNFNEGAAIVNISSMFGVIAPDFRVYDGNEQEYSSLAYGSSKAAIIQMTKYLSVLYSGRPVRVNAVSPGGILGQQSETFLEKYGTRVPLGRMVTPEEVINGILFLLSPLSSGITGTNLLITAGLEVW